MQVINTTPDFSDVLPSSLVKYANEVNDRTGSAKTEAHPNLDALTASKDRNPTAKRPVNAFLVSSTMDMIELNRILSNPTIKQKVNSVLTNSGIAGITTATVGFLSVAFWVASKWQELTPNTSDGDAQTQISKQPAMRSVSSTEIIATVGVVGSAMGTIIRGIQQARSAGTTGEIEILKSIHQSFKDTEKTYTTGIPTPPLDNVAVLKRLTIAFNRTCREKNTEKVKSYLERYVWTRAIPLEKKETSYMKSGADQAKRKAIDDNVEELVLSEHPDNQEALQSYIDRVRAGEKVLLWMYGKPGVGKTRFGKEIAQSLECAHIPVTDAEKQTGTLDLAKALGEKQDRDPDYYSERSITDLITPFCRDLIECGHTNPFAQIDELGDAMNNDNRVNILRYIKTHQDRDYHDISGLNSLMPNDINFIITTNIKFTIDMVPESERESFKAFFERIFYLEKKPLTVEIKRDIASKAWEKAIAKLQDNHNDPKPIDDMRDRVLAISLDENERLGIGGARVLIKCINAIIIDLFNKKYRRVYDAADPGHPISDEQILHIVRSRFRESVLASPHSAKREPAKAAKMVDAGVQTQWDDTGPMTGGTSRSETTQPVVSDAASTTMPNQEIPPPAA